MLGENEKRVKTINEFRVELVSELENRLANLEKRVETLEKAQKSKSGHLELRDLSLTSRNELNRYIDQRIRSIMAEAQEVKRAPAQEDRRTEIQMVDSKPSEEKRISSISDLLGLFRKQG